MAVNRDNDPLARWLERPREGRSGPQPLSDLETAGQQLASQLIERRDNILRAVHLATERFLRMPPGETSIEPFLEALGEAAEVSRVYIFENHTDPAGAPLISQRHEWVQAGIESQLLNQDLQNIAWHSAAFARWAEVLGRGEIIHGNIDQLPPTEQPLLRAQAIRSILVAPIFVGQRWWGFIGFDECRRAREWSAIEIEALQTAANIIGATFQHQFTAKALLESEQKYRLVVENALEAIIITQDGMLKFVNAAGEKISGYSIAELTSKPFLEFVHPEDREMVAGHHLRRLSGEEVPEVYRLRMVNKNGDIIRLENNGVVLEWEGRPGTLNFLSDITARYRTEKALRKSEAQKQAILDASIDCIWHLDRELRFLWYNRATAEGLQKDASEVIGRTCYQVFHRRTIPCEQCPTIKARDSGQIERATMHFDWHKCLDQSNIWDVYSVPIKGPTGEAISFIQVSRNISDLIRTVEALRESEEKYRLLFESESDAVMVFDAETELFEDANRATLDLFGYSKDEFLQLTVGDVSAEKDKTRTRVEELKRNHPGSRKVPLRYFLRKDGSRFPGEIFAGSFISGGRKKLIGAVRDISDHLQAREKIHALTRQLIKTQENERHRISHYLHDQVVQDLSIIKIGCDTLFEQAKASDVRLPEKIAGYSKLLQRSITAVRDLAYDLRPPGMDQLGLVRTAFQYCSDFSSRTGIEIDFFTAGMEDVDLDFDTKINIFRMIQEGLNNIRRHAEASRAAVRLLASTPNIILRIEDNGKGFQVSERLAEALKEKRMGLSSLEERVGLLGGSLTIQSTPAEGTKIKVEIPIRE